MLDADIRAVLHRQLTHRHAGRDVLVRDEVGLCLGEARIDVAVIDDCLTGYEIKSHQDRLHRLASQAEIYGRVLDRVILVAAGRHLEAATVAVPVWWGIWRADADGDSVRLVEIRAAGRNEAMDALSIAQLLWRDEALQVLSDHGMAKGLRSANRWTLWGALTVLPSDVLAAEVRSRLKVRPVWPAA